MVSDPVAILNCLFITNAAPLYTYQCFVTARKHSCPSPQSSDRAILPTLLLQENIIVNLSTQLAPAFADAFCTAHIYATIHKHAAHFWPAALTLYIFQRLLCSSSHLSKHMWPSLRQDTASILLSTSSFSSLIAPSSSLTSKLIAAQPFCAGTIGDHVALLLGFGALAGDLNFECGRCCCLVRRWLLWRLWPQQMLRRWQGWQLWCVRHTRLRLGCKPSFLPLQLFSPQHTTFVHSQTMSSPKYGNPSNYSRLPSRPPSW